jgi:hypothetical protein
MDTKTRIQFQSYKEISGGRKQCGIHKRYGVHDYEWEQEVTGMQRGGPRSPWSEAALRHDRDSENIGES